MIPFDRDPAVLEPTLEAPSETDLLDPDLQPPATVPAPRVDLDAPLEGVGWRRSPRGTRPAHRGRQARWTLR